jgi:hypothetical protein
LLNSICDLLVLPGEPGIQSNSAVPGRVPPDPYGEMTTRDNLSRAQGRHLKKFSTDPDSDYSIEHMFDKIDA